MHLLLKKRLDLLTEIQDYLDKNNIKYYLGGNLLINAYKDITPKSNVSFVLNICVSSIHNIEDLCTNKRVIKPFKDKNNKISYYKYMDRTTLYCNLDDPEKSSEKGIFIKIYVHKKDYEKYITKTIDKYNVRVPENFDEYMKKTFGLGYKYLLEKTESLPKTIIWDVNIPYHDYFDSLLVNDMKFDKSVFAELNEIAKKEAEYNKVINNYKTIINRTDARFKLLKEYEDKKSEILKYGKEKDYKKLFSLLEDYLIQIKKFYDNKLSLCFDKDIFDVTIDYLKHEKEVELASWLVDNVPEAHLKNIDFSYKDKNANNNNQYKDLDYKHLEIMKRLDEYCKKHNIEYYGDGGTVLGAVRHEGFIPWDCDIDICMSYDNYDKFIKTIKNDPIEGTKFVCFENEPNYTVHFGRLYDLSSFRMYYTDSLLTSSYGYHLDIFPFDEAHDDPKESDYYDKLLRLYGELLNPDSQMYDKNYSKYIKICNFIMHITGRKLFLKALHKKLFNNKKKSKTRLKYRWRKKMFFDKTTFGTPQYVPFENIMIPIPEDYEKYLEVQYGESWFVYPLKEDQTESGKIFNLYVPYYMYQDDFLSFIDKKEVNKAFRKYKMSKMQRSGLNKKAESLKIKYHFYKNKINIKNDIDCNKVYELFNKNEFGSLREYLDNYYYLQLKGSLIDRDLVFIKNKEFLYDVTYTLIMTGEFYEARKLLKLKTVKKVLSKEYEELTKLMDNIKNVRKLSNKEKEKLYKENPYCLSFYTEYYPLMKKNEKAKEVDKMNKIYPNFGESIYINGLYLIENDNKAEGLKEVKKATDKTRNGLLILEMNKLLKKETTK